MDSLDNAAKQDHSGSIENLKPDSEQYSLTMVDTIFADTLSRGMQNAITSQQNAQMASSTSITNACARILQARASAPISAPIKAPETTPKEASVAPLLTAVAPLSEVASIPNKQNEALSEFSLKNAVSPNKQNDNPIPDTTKSVSKAAIYWSLGVLTTASVAGASYLIYTL